MTDALANKLVELDLLLPLEVDGVNYYAVVGDSNYELAEVAIEDGRVMAALMQLVIDGEWIHDGDEWYVSVMIPGSNINFTGTHKSLNCAIVMACVEALG